MHPNDGMGLVSWKMFRKGDPVGYYYGVLVYANLSRRPQQNCVYGEGMIDVTVEELILEVGYYVG